MYNNNNLSDYLSSSIFKAIANMSSKSVFIYVKSIDFKYVFLSKNMGNLINLNYHEALGKTDYDFDWSKEQADTFRNDDLFVLNTGKTHISEYLLPIAKKFLWIKTEKIPIFDKNNDIIGILGIAQDITIYKKEALPQKQIINQSEHNNISRYISSPIFKAIASISSKNTFIYVKSIDLKYVFLGKNMCNLSNLNYHEALGKTDYDFGWGKEQADTFRNDDLFVLNTGKTHISEYLLPIAKKFLWIKTEKIPIFDKNNNVIGILGIAQDVTYRKKILSQKQIVNSSNQNTKLLRI
ncbi:MULTISPECIES: PAS domain-containing protein [Francisella]|uniref:PAC domain-containing protein n=1 Tax=Francisella opportunistica TaxID=2016517 RepID=A0A345JRE4_9GAMM|nr:MULTISPECIES: PAS domain-containing protein [Francisella]APC91617.1 Two-component sensor histidine kinase [Francisella sp. MA067296]AXH29890.1 hypothetical protein CGC43_04485 [Francisella opportunistica]AXH31537.1 hypothetical protein CGC44_04445 [Francisella opportunistica]AXH33185.1 hypothetical protein CGC45_04470 [Francisella opportunistica]